MERSNKIEQVMTKNVITVEISDNIWEIEKTFNINHLRHAPVCDKGQVAGMISLMDLRRNLLDNEEDIEKRLNNSLKAHHIMSPEPISLQKNQTISEAAQVFIDNDFHALPVLDGFDLVGILSTTDVIKYLLSKEE